MNPEDEAEEDGANIDLDSQRKGKCVVLKTSTRQVKWMNIFIFLAKDTIHIQISISAVTVSNFEIVGFVMVIFSCAFSEKRYWYTFCNVELNNVFF